MNVRSDSIPVGPVRVKAVLDTKMSKREDRIKNETLETNKSNLRSHHTLMYTANKSNSKKFLKNLHGLHSYGQETKKLAGNKPKYNVHHD